MASIDRKSIDFSQSGIPLSLTKPRKYQRSGPLHVLKLKRFATNSILCRVACLERYITVSDPFRNQNSSTLYLGLKSPHHEIGASTIARWIKSILQSAGVDIAIFSAHSTRSASSSKASAAGVPIEKIILAGSWPSESVFNRYYRRETVSINLTETILDTNS